MDDQSMVWHESLVKHDLAACVRTTMHKHDILFADVQGSALTMHYNHERDHHSGETVKDAAKQVVG